LLTETTAIAIKITPTELKVTASVEFPVKEEIIEENTTLNDHLKPPQPTTLTLDSDAVTAAPFKNTGLSQEEYRIANDHSSIGMATPKDPITPITLSPRNGAAQVRSKFNTSGIGSLVSSLESESPSVSLSMSRTPEINNQSKVSFSLNNIDATKQVKAKDDASETDNSDTESESESE